MDTRKQQDGASNMGQKWAAAKCGLRLGDLVLVLAGTCRIKPGSDSAAGATATPAAVARPPLQVECFAVQSLEHA